MLQVLPTIALTVGAYNMIANLFLAVRLFIKVKRHEETSATLKMALISTELIAGFAFVAAGAWYLAVVCAVIYMVEAMVVLSLHRKES